MMTSSIIPHLIELRKRLLYVFIAIGLGIILTYLLKEQIVNILLIPVKQVRPDSPLIFIGVPDVFFTYLKLSIYGGIFLSVPVLCYQLWKFISPALHSNEKNTAWPFLIFTPILFYTGAFFAQFIVMPLAIKFFFSFENTNITALPALKEYFAFTLKMLLAFGVSFTLPMAMLLLVSLGWVTPKSLAITRRYVVVGLVAIAAIFTPPDPFSQIILAIPLWVLYEVAILASKYMVKTGS